jgi:hypothetical protein
MTPLMFFECIKLAGYCNTINHSTPYLFAWIYEEKSYVDTAWPSAAALINCLCITGLDVKSTNGAIREIKAVLQ